MILHFQNKINIIMYIIEEKKTLIISYKISIRYLFSKFMFL
jgi:hypothetical protein